MSNKVIIQGSSKSFGNTFKAVTFLNKNNDFDIIDLSSKNIRLFDYEFKNYNDDFIPLIENIIIKYDTIIFATPLYWYSMSGILKVFFDRISDLLIIHKNLGRQLRGKNMGLLSNSNTNDLLDGFTMPFKASAKYLGMNYLGDIHVWFTKDGKKIHADALTKINEFKTYTLSLLL